MYILRGFFGFGTETNSNSQTLGTIPKPHIFLHRNTSIVSKTCLFGYCLTHQTHSPDSRMPSLHIFCLFSPNFCLFGFNICLTCLPWVPHDNHSRTQIISLTTVGGRASLFSDGEFSCRHLPFAETSVIVGLLDHLTNAPGGRMRHLQHRSRTDVVN